MNSTFPLPISPNVFCHNPGGVPGGDAVECCKVECNEGIWYIRTIMFEYGTKSDVEGRQASRVAYCRGAAVLGAVVGTLGLLSGQTLLGLSNLVSAVGFWAISHRRPVTFKRFQSRISPWRVFFTVLWIICVVSPFLLRPSNLLSWPSLLWALLLAALFPLSLPQYAEFRDDGLFLRHGWRSFLIPYASLTAVRRTTSAPLAPFYLLSTEPIRLLMQGKKGFTVAVAEETDFLIEIMMRCPQLERWNFGLRRRV